MGANPRRRKRRRCLSRRTKNVTGTVSETVSETGTVNARSGSEKKKKRGKKIVATGTRSVSVHEAGIVTGRSQGVMIEVFVISLSRCWPAPPPVINLLTNQENRQIAPTA